MIPLCKKILGVDGELNMYSGVDLIIGYARGWRRTVDFSTYCENGAQKHVRNEQTFLEYLVPTALEKIWETLSLEAGVAREGWGGIGGVSTSMHTRTRTRTTAPLALPFLFLCARTRAKQAQGLNFNYFLFGRYNISMLAGAWPARTRLSLPFLSSNVIIIILVCARSVISCTPRPPHPPRVHRTPLSLSFSSFTFSTPTPTGSSVVALSSPFYLAFLIPLLCSTSSMSRVLCN